MLPHTNLLNLPSSCESTLWASIERAFEISSELELAHHDVPSNERAQYIEPVAAQIAAIRAESYAT